MSDFNLVDPKGWEYDLQSIYSAYIGYFQIHNVPWYERSWGHLFESFEEFLTFSWPVITVTDRFTGRPHIVTRYNSIGAFLKMIKTRFGETLPVVDNMFQVSPFENTQRHLRTVSDWATYKKLHSTLPAVVLSATKARIRAGEPKVIQDLWNNRDKTFLAIDFEWSERNSTSCLEWGFAAVRCGHLEALSHWPPVPDSNYRKGHYIVSEYVDKVVNKHCPTHPWQYAFGESQMIPKTKLPQIIQAVISLASPESETVSNNLVLVGHGIHGDLSHLEEMKIKIPHNVLIIDTGSYERSLFSAKLRGSMLDPKTNKPRAAGTTLSLENVVHSLQVNVPCAYHNSGNDAFMCLFALQKLLDPENTATPTPKARPGRPGLGPTPGTVPGRSQSAGIIPTLPTASMGPIRTHSASQIPTSPAPLISFAPGTLPNLNGVYGSPLKSMHNLAPPLLDRRLSTVGNLDPMMEFGQVRRLPRPQSTAFGAATAHDSKTSRQNGKTNKGNRL